MGESESKQSDEGSAEPLDGGGEPDALKTPATKPASSDGDQFKSAVMVVDEPQQPEENESQQEVEGGEGEEEEGEEEEEEKPIKLYKSTRLKGYITMTVASVINYDSAQKSSDVLSPTVVPSTNTQRRYAVAVAVVSLVFSAAALAMHLDRLTPLEPLWVRMFQPKAKFELGLAIFLILWWSVAVGIETSVQGIAGDGRGQFSLYYSSWACCLTSYWILERWWVAAGYSSLKSFITSWPYRAPGWILILFLSTFTLIWYIDLWQNFDQLAGNEQLLIVYQHFKSVPEGQWQWLIIIGTFTVFPSLIFVLIELLRETKPDGSNEEKGRAETAVEGVMLLLLVLAWIPTVMIATTPGGAASLIGNAYFFTWLLVIFILETFVWFVHDMRKTLHLALKQKKAEYHERQRQVLQETREIQRRKALEDGRTTEDHTDSSNSDPTSRKRMSTEFFDPAESMDG